MGVEIGHLASDVLPGRDGQAVFLCNTDEIAFGPIMANRQEARAFMDWLDKDPRRYTDGGLKSAYTYFRAEIAEEMDA